MILCAVVNVHVRGDKYVHNIAMPYAVVCCVQQWIFSHHLTPSPNDTMPFQNRVYTTDMQDQQYGIETRSLPAPALKKDGSLQGLLWYIWDQCYMRSMRRRE